MKLSAIQNWKKLGRQDPYYGVLTDEKYRAKNITDQDIKEFFMSGEIFVKESANRIKSLFNQSLEECSILDFGCGVGRLAIPFARLSGKKVMGLDVSPEIIDKANGHKKAMGITNLELKVFDGASLPPLPSFDFINSYIVFQHIEPSLGYPLLRQLLEKLNPGGIIQFQITYGHSLPKLKYWNFLLRGKVPVYNYVYSLLKNGRLGAEAVMQMNHYSPEKLFNLFSKHSTQVHVEFTNHGGHLGAFYLLKKNV
jgi:SAM-dependent methyltransferase